VEPAESMREEPRGTLLLAARDLAKRNAIETRLKSWNLSLAMRARAAHADEEGDVTALTGKSSPKQPKKSHRRRLATDYPKVCSNSTLGISALAAGKQSKPHEALERKKKKTIVPRAVNDALSAGPSVRLRPAEPRELQGFDYWVRDAGAVLAGQRPGALSRICPRPTSVHPTLPR
jgi:hypothetical protein